MASGVHPVAGWRGWPLVAALSAVVTVFTWRSTAWRGVSAGINSWQVGLELGFVHHSQWGPQLLFTFGPYGFVEDILPLSRLTAAVALVYALAVTWCLVALIICALRPSWALLPAAAVAWASVVTAANMLEAPELALGTALGLALAAVWEPGEARRGRLVGALGALAGFQLLVELNVGLVTTGLAVLAVLGGERRAYRALAGVVPWLAVPLVACAAAGQSITNTFSYLRGSLQVTLGYSSSMSSSGGRGAEDVFAAVLALIVAAVYWLAARDRPRRTRLAVALMLAGWGWEALKEGFVRHDLHDLTFFGLVLVGLALAKLPRPLVPVQAVALATAAVFAVVANGSIVSSAGSPLEDAAALGREVADLVNPSALRPLEQASKDELLETGDYLPPKLVASLAPYTVAAEPWEVGLTYAYPQLHWRPEPVLQSYSAYTGYLDTLDAKFLSSSQAPQRVLYQPEAIDDQYPFWAPPGAELAMLCHYTQVGTAGSWEVLGRVADRCGRPRLIETAVAHFGRSLHVPSSPGDLVVARFRLTSPWWAQVEGFLLKPPATSVEARSGAILSAYRFLEGTAGEDHIMSVPGGGPGATNQRSPLPMQRLVFLGLGWKPGQGRVSVSFYAVSLAPHHHSFPTVGAQ